MNAKTKLAWWLTWNYMKNMMSFLAFPLLVGMLYLAMNNVLGLVLLLTGIPYIIVYLALTLPPFLRLKRMVCR